MALRLTYIIDLFGRFFSCLKSSAEIIRVMTFTPFKFPCQFASFVALYCVFANFSSSREPEIAYLFPQYVKLWPNTVHRKSNCRMESLCHTLFLHADVPIVVLCLGRTQFNVTYRPCSVIFFNDLLGGTSCTLPDCSSKILKAVCLPKWSDWNRLVGSQLERSSARVCQCSQIR